MRKQSQFLHIELEPKGPPEIEGPSPVDGKYWISWEDPCLNVEINPENLRALIAAAQKPTPIV